MMKCFSLIASKADIELAKKALEIAHTDATTEMENYKRILGKLGLELRQVVESEPSPTNEAYMNFLIKTCALGTPLESLVAVLPCFWTYLEIAKYHKESLKNNPVKIYVEWAQPYLSKEYEALVTELIDLINSRSGNQEYAILKNLFIKGSRYEWMFWDMAYRMEKWPI
jgi:thiaminase/transcriptional activator TenA